MQVLKNILALVGLLALIVLAVGYFSVKSSLAALDPKALPTYSELFTKVLETKNGAEATIWKVPVKEGLSPEEVEETMKFVANELNMSNVGELPLYKDVEAKSGEKYRFVKIYMFCDSLTAARMLDYSDAYSAYLPCRITLVEDKEGKLWLIALNMDLMIYGGSTLPPELKQEALGVKDKLMAIMERGAAGEF